MAKKLNFKTTSFITKEPVKLSKTSLKLVGNLDLFSDTIIDSSIQKSEQSTPIIKTKLEVEEKDLVKAFQNALMAKDLNVLSNLLHEKGEYQAQNRTLDIVPVNKQQYINWLRFKLQSSSIKTVETKKCFGCYKGCIVSLFNNADFPHILKQNSYTSNAAMMVKIKNNKIVAVRFCFNHIETKNNWGI